jgi:hypothetical protein
MTRQSTAAITPATTATISTANASDVESTGKPIEEAAVMAADRIIAGRTMPTISRFSTVDPHFVKLVPDIKSLV